MPATYAEPKGFTLIEAMANGVPIVQPSHGAFTEIVNTAGGGVLVTPGDPDLLADALFALLVDRERAQALGRAGADGVRQHYSLEQMAKSAEAVYVEAGASLDRRGPLHPA
jgi:glycosyltransferase involved in cell wall biosynthesis